MPQEKTHEAYFVDDKGQRFKFTYTGDIPPTREQILAARDNVAEVNLRGAFGGGNIDLFTSREASNRPPVPYDELRRDPNQIPMMPGAERFPVPPFHGNPEGAMAAGGEALNWVGSSLRNAAQGATASTLRAYDNSPAGQNPSPNWMQNLDDIFRTPAPGWGREALDAVIANDGDRRIGDLVPELAPNTIPGAVYNVGTAIGSDPLNLATAGIGAAMDAAKVARVVRTAEGLSVGRQVPAIPRPGALLGETVEGATAQAERAGIQSVVQGAEAARSTLRPDLANVDLAKWGDISAETLAAKFPEGETPLADGPKLLGLMPDASGKPVNAYLLGHKADGTALVAYGEENLPHVIDAAGDTFPSPPALAPDDPRNFMIEPGDSTGTVSVPSAVPLPETDLLPEPAPTDGIAPRMPVQPRDAATGRFVKQEATRRQPAVPDPVAPASGTGDRKIFGLPSQFAEPTPAQLAPASDSFSSLLTDSAAGAGSSITPPVASPALPDDLYAPLPGLSPTSEKGLPFGNPFAGRGAQVGGKALDAYDAVDGTMRSGMFGYDLSAPLRQGLLLGATRPAHVAKALGAQFRAALSESNAMHEIAGIANRPNAKLYEETGLYVPTAADADNLYRREEMFAKTMLHKIPGVGDFSKASDRAMTAYLTRLRADVFDSTATGWARRGMTPETNPAEYKGLADYINTFSGRGNLGALEKNAPALARVFSSPRLQVSRIQTINPIYYAKLPKATRLLAMRDAAAVIGGNLALVEMAKAYGEAHPESGVSASTDPRSTDFMKVRIKNTTIDMTGGSGSWARFCVQVGLGTRIDPSGKAHVVSPFGDNEGKDKGRGGAVGVHTEGRMAPLPSLLWQATRGTDYDGDPFRMDKALGERIVPLWWQDAQDAVAEHGPLLGSAMGALSFSGGSVNTKRPTDPTDAPREPLPSEKLLPPRKPATNPDGSPRYNDADY